MPQPFRPGSSDKARLALASAEFVSGVRVLPIEELPPGSGEALAERLSADLRARGVAASTSPAMRNARLLKPILFTDVSGTWVRWELFEADGQLRESVVTALPRPDNTAGQTLASLVDAVAISLRPREERRPVARNASLEIGAISGAPGNGNAALRKAASFLFDRAGIDLADDGDTAGLTLNAVVTVRPLDDQADLLTLAWSVVTPNGEEVGRLAQENAMPKQALAGDWGPLAFDAVRGLIESIRAVQVAYRTAGS